MNPFDLIGVVFNLVFKGPIVNLLVLIFQGLSSLYIPGALGWAIIIMTLLIRFLVWPFISSQIKSAKMMMELKPLLNVLKDKHKGDRAALSAAQMALYKEHGVNPAGGCIPALIQLPVFIALANAIPLLFNGDLTKINDLIYWPGLKLASTPDPHFLIFNLGDKLMDKTLFTPDWYLLMLVPLITMILSFIQSKMMAPAKSLKINKADTKSEVKEKEGMEDAMSAMQSQMLFMMPIMIGFFSYQFPVGLSLYWNIFTLVGIIQQYKIAGWGGLEGWVNLVKTRI